MDELVFRSSQKIESLQVQLGVVATQTKDVMHLYAEQSKSAFSQAWNSSYNAQFKQGVKDLWVLLVDLGNRFKEHIFIHLQAQRLYSLLEVFSKNWTRRDVCFLSAGFILGGIAGSIYMNSMRKGCSDLQYMQAVQCHNYLGIESAAVIENVLAPHKCRNNEVLIDVKAGSVQVIDAYITRGYGHSIRPILQSLSGNRSERVTLGRDCTGVVLKVGSNVRKVDVGDEVWVAVPFWMQGTLSQTLLVPDHWVGLKPKTVSFDAACSFPYAASVALGTLKTLGVTQENAKGLKVLIVDGCTPVGCVLIQILTHWKAKISTSSFLRALPVVEALGAKKVTICPDFATQEGEIEITRETRDFFLKELEDSYDYGIITRNCGISEKDLEAFCINGVISTIPKSLESDTYGTMGTLLFKFFLKFQHLLGVISFEDFDETHMCNATLDEIAQLVETGCLQPVVDKILHPHEIDIALNHIQSNESIGSTVIRFR